MCHPFLLHSQQTNWIWLVDDTFYFITGKGHRWVLNILSFQSSVLRLSIVDRLIVASLEIYTYHDLGSGRKCFDCGYFQYVSQCGYFQYVSLGICIIVYLWFIGGSHFAHMFHTEILCMCTHIYIVLPYRL